VTDPAEKTATRPDASTKLAIERTYLAYERTMLSWVRTATALITFGFGIQQFFRIARQGQPESRGLIGPHGFGLAGVAVGDIGSSLGHTDVESAISDHRAISENSPFQGESARCIDRDFGVLALISMLLRE
jgi:putative membrane protein